MKLDWLLVEILLVFEMALWNCLTIYLLALINCHCWKMLLLRETKRLAHLGLRDKRILVDENRVDLSYCLTEWLEVLRCVGCRLDLGQGVKLRGCVYWLELPCVRQPRLSFVLLKPLQYHIDQVPE